MMKSLFAITIIMFGISCSSSAESDFPQSFASAGSFSPSPRFNALLMEPRTVLEIEFIELGVAGKLVLEQKDGQYSRFLSADLGAFVLQHGMLHSLYGFGEPLVGAELSETLELVLAGRSGLADRFHTYLDGEDRAVSRTFRCEISARGTAEVMLPNRLVQALFMHETCRSLSHTFENLYWVDTDQGEIIQSRQWAGSHVGSVVTRISAP